jgi:COP9 signalosome complex subunit 4
MTVAARNASHLQEVCFDIAPFCFRSTLERLQPRAVSFEEQSTILRENLAKLLEEQEQWTQAAHVLAGIDLDSGKRGPGLYYQPKYVICTRNEKAGDQLPVLGLDASI